MLSLRPIIDELLTKPVDFDQFVHIVHSIDNFWLTLVKLPPRRA
jgi:hypothetical protein